MRHRQRLAKTSFLLASALCSAFFSGCGYQPSGAIKKSSSSTTVTTSNSTLTEVSLASSATSVATGGTVTFTASGGQTPYTFSVLSGSGSINSSTGVFTAPSSAGTSVIEVMDSAGQWDTLSVTITASTATALSVSPTSITISADQTLILTVSGGTSPYQYALVSGEGTLSNGSYRAPSAATTAQIRVTDAASQTATVTVTVTASTTSAALVDIYRLYSPSNGDHMLSLNSQEATTIGYLAEGRRFSFYADSSVSGTVPLYRCMYSGQGGARHFASLDSACEGRTNEGILGYVSTTQTTGLVPLHRFYHGGLGDHLITTDYSEGTGAGYGFESTLGYVTP